MCAFAWCLFLLLLFLLYSHTNTHGICKRFVIKRKDIKENERKKINWTSVKRETDGKQMQLQLQRNKTKNASKSK